MTQLPKKLEDSSARYRAQLSSLLGAITREINSIDSKPGLKFAPSYSIKTMFQEAITLNDRLAALTEVADDLSALGAAQESDPQEKTTAIASPDKSDTDWKTADGNSVKCPNCGTVGYDNLLTFQNGLWVENCDWYCLNCRNTNAIANPEKDALEAIGQKQTKYSDVVLSQRHPSPVAEGVDDRSLQGRYDLILGTNANSDSDDEEQESDTGTNSDAEEPEYHFVKDSSLELIHTLEFLAMELSQSYENWYEILTSYRSLGPSVTPGHHVLKYKGDLNILKNDCDLYTDIPFSDLYKKDPVKASTPLSQSEWTAIVEQKKQKSANPFWKVYQLPW